MQTIHTGTAMGPGTVTSTVINRHSKGIRLFLDITAETGTATLDVKVQVYNQLADKWIDLPGAAFPQQSGTGHAMLTIYPSLTTVTANVAVAQYVAAPWRASITEAGGGSTMTFTLNYEPLDR